MINTIKHTDEEVLEEINRIRKLHELPPVSCIEKGYKRSAHRCPIANTLSKDDKPASFGVLPRHNYDSPIGIDVEYYGTPAGHRALDHYYAPVIGRWAAEFDSGLHEEYLLVSRTV